MPKSSSRKPRRTSSNRGPYHVPRKPRKNEDPRLLRVSKIALALPETARELYGSHAGFTVRKKTFAYFLDNHHGDGIVGLACKVLPGDNDALIRSNAEKFYPPAYLAHKGWVALRLDLGKIDWDEVSDLILTSYHLVAPPKLAKSIEALLGGV
jgi:predicted DNA-binding protein (MmcQ/YjbR family)